VSETEVQPQDETESKFVAPEPKADTLEHPEGEPAITEEDAAESAETEEGGESIEGTDSDLGGEQDDEEDAPLGEYAPGVAEARLITERERKARDKALDKERERHAANLGKILGDEATHLVPCPVCIEAFDGWIFDPAYSQLSTEMALRMKQILGIDDWEDTPQASWAQTCSTCNGHGRVKTGSKVESRETTQCLDCSGAGWINLHERPTSNGHHEIEIPSTTGPTVYGTEEPDPRIQSLREEGFMVVPPTVLPAGA